MAVTLTGTFTKTGAGRHSDVDTYTSNSIGAAGLASQTLHYVTWFKPASGDAFDEGYQNTLTDMKAVLTISVMKKSGMQDDGLKLRFYKSAPLDGIDNTEEDLYRSLLEYNIYGAEFIGAEEIVKTGLTSNDRETTITVTVTDAQKLEYLLAYGVSFDAAYGNYYQIGEVALTLTGESNEDAPEITVDTSGMAGVLSEGTYYHPAGDSDFTIGVTYSQELGTAMQELRYSIKPEGGAIVTGSTTGLSFTVPRSCWTEVPASGVVEITALSAHGILSDTLTLPYVITHYNLQITSPVSGAIIPEGEDVVLAWNLVLPEGMPSAPVPTRYTIWPAWDGETEFQVAYDATERTYTIPADSLAGHTKLRLLILDEYGTGGISGRKKDSGALVMLYLQPSAALNEITVSTEYTDGLYTPLLTVSWTAEGQTAFQITADEFDTGPVWGTATQYTIPKIFADGIHVIRLRIQDANGDWGEWSSPVYAEVANRIEETVVFPEQSVSGGIITNLQYEIQPGMGYNVSIDGVVYTCTAYSLGSSGAYLGNPTLGGSTGVHNDEPFYIEWYGGTATSAMFYKDSSLSYPLTVKVTESYGTVALTATKAEKTGVRLSIKGDGDMLTMADVLIYRDGALIAQLPGTTTLIYEYVDAEACGACTYFVRLVMSGGFYAQSNSAVVDAVPATDGILLPDGTWIALRYTQTAPRSYRSTQNEETYTQHFAGREYPVSMRSGRRTRVLSMEYIDSDGAICDVLEAHTGAVVLYKTTLGFGIQGEINNVTAGRGKAWSTVSFRISQCAEPAEMQYMQGVNAVGI